MAISPATSATLAKIGIGAAAALAGIGIGLLVTGGGSAPAAGIAIAWIDQPLDGAEYSNAPIAITAHATDPDGVATVTLSIDGTVILTSTVAGTPTLATVETEWTPTVTGQHELTVVAIDRGGSSGTAARSRFTVVDDPGPLTPDATTTTSTTSTTSTTIDSTTSTSTSVAPDTTVPITTLPTPTTRPTTPPTTTRPTTPPTTTPPTSPPTTTPPTTTTTTVPTSTTTTPPCVPDVPIPTSPFNGEVLLTSTPTLSWNYRGCGPDTFTVQVADNEFFVSGRGSYVAASNVAGSARSTAWSSLACQRTYYWHIRSNGATSQSAWSSTQSFYIDC